MTEHVSVEVFTRLKSVNPAELLKGATPDPRKQTSVGQGLIHISVTTENGERWGGPVRWCVSQREVTRDGLTHRLAEGNLMRRCRKLL